MEYVAKIAAKGGTLAQAQKMGLRDAFVDYWFRNGAKKQEIKDLFDRLRSIATEKGASIHAESLLHYDALKKLLRSPESSWLKTSVDRANHTWSYQMGFGDPKTADNVVVSYSNIPIEDAVVLTKFQEYKCLDAVVRQLEKKVVDQRITSDAAQAFREQLTKDFNDIDQVDPPRSAGLSWQKICKIQDRLFELPINRDSRTKHASRGLWTHLNIVVDFPTAGAYGRPFNFAQKPIRVCIGNELIAHYQCETPKDVVDALVANAKLSARETAEMLEATSAEGDGLEAFQEMSDEEIVRKYLNDEANNSFFCQTNLKTIVPSRNGTETFQAVFREERPNREPHEKTINFSNSDSRNGEFKGSELQQRLLTWNYGSLAELVRSASGTASDSKLVYGMMPALNNFTRFFGGGGRHQGIGHFHEDTSGFFELTHHQADQLYLQAQTTLANVPVTQRATFGELWNWPDEKLKQRIALEAPILGAEVSQGQFEASAVERFEIPGTEDLDVGLEEFPFDVEAPDVATASGPKPAPAQPSALWHLFGSLGKHTDLNWDPISKNRL
jgi:hypothetical protein